jgi:hypothetical protein
LRDQAFQHVRIFLIREELLPRGQQARRGAPDNRNRRRRDARLRRLPRALLRQRFFDLRQDRAQCRHGGAIEPFGLRGFGRRRGPRCEGVGESRDDLFGGV